VASANTSAGASSGSGSGNSTLSRFIKPRRKVATLLGGKLPT
jgi:hypothetical protein